MESKNRTLGIKDLVEILELLNITSARQWVYRKMKAGKLDLPKKPFAPKRYDLNLDVIEEAAIALRDKGEYIFERDSKYVNKKRR